MASGPLTQADVRQALSGFKDPETGRSAIQLEQIRDIHVHDGVVSLTLALSTHSAPLWAETQQALEQTLRTAWPHLVAVRSTRVVLERPPQKVGEIGLAAKTVIAVGSGKGGVGKSTIAASLALGLKRAGCVVGLMDADVYGPSLPHLLGIQGQPQLVNEKIQPIRMDGMPVMSMGFVIRRDQAVVWRGPMLHGAITQFLRDTDWGDLDYLIIDMPPGTGDIAISLSQLLQLTGAVVVCTPQDVALLDAAKAIAMFRMVNIPVLGMIENMSGFVCPDCQKRYDIFGRGGAAREAVAAGVPFLGDVPINMQIRVHGDEGKTIANFDDATVAPYLESICYRLAKNLAESAAKDPPTPVLPVLG
ncbi:MAG: Mrp/NBP35 family ATP-binding protein [Pirellulaceae bacterium]